jgi:hypothetical protein
VQRVGCAYALAKRCLLNRELVMERELGSLIFKNATIASPQRHPKYRPVSFALISCSGTLDSPPGFGTILLQMRPPHLMLSTTAPLHGKDELIYPKVPVSGDFGLALIPTWTSKKNEKAAKAMMTHRSHRTQRFAAGRWSLLHSACACTAHVLWRLMTHHHAPHLAQTPLLYLTYVVMSLLKMSLHLLSW